jgi:hypothetical protein
VIDAVAQPHDLHRPLRRQRVLEEDAVPQVGVRLRQELGRGLLDHRAELPVGPHHDDGRGLQAVVEEAFDAMLERPLRRGRLEHHVAGLDVGADALEAVVFECRSQV